MFEPDRNHSCYLYSNFSAARNANMWPQKVKAHDRELPSTLVLVVRDKDSHSMILVIPDSGLEPDSSYFLPHSDCCV